MGEVLKKAIKGNTWFKVFSIAALVLLFASFVLPPLGEIHPSALAGAGIIFAFAALGTVNHAIDNGKSASVKHKDIEFSVGDKE